MSLDLDRSDPALLKIRFILESDHPPGQVSVVGSFNDWRPGLDALVDDGRGVRSVTLGLPYGLRLVFRYLGPDGGWFDDADADEITGEGSIIHPVQPQR